jgi:hypothetical protein
VLVGQKHLLTCRCILSQLRGDPNAPLHQFVAFSVRDDDTDEMVPKTVQCNNCGVLHRVVDYCTSEVLDGKESSKAILTIDDIKVSLQPNVVSVLEDNDADLPSWEQAAFIVENERWGGTVFLESENDGDSRHGKYVTIFSENLCRVKTFTRDEVAK